MAPKHPKILLTSDFHYGHTSYTHTLLSSFLEDIAVDKPDAMLIAGDLVSHGPEQMEPCLRLLREILPDMPILVVLGNHDWWSSETRWKQWPFDRLFNHYNKLFEQYNITWLENQTFMLGNISFYGFDGWYGGNPHGVTNDEFWMSVDLMDYLHNRAISSAAWILDKLHARPRGIHKTVVLTHFDFTDHAMSGDHKHADDLARAGVDIICCGHSHHRKEDIWDIVGSVGPSILNAGSDYDDPKKIIFLD